MKKYQETDFEVFLQKISNCAQPILLAHLKERLSCQEDFDELLAFHQHCENELEVFLTSEKDQKLYARKFNLGGYPIYILIINGKEVSRILGSANRNDLKKLYKKHCRN